MTLVLSINQIKELLPGDVNLLAVSKGHPEESILSVFKTGHFEFGESRLQEALPKIKNLSNLNSLKWHFIGRLQSNKVRGVVKNFDVIHSVHSLELGERISRIAEQENRLPSVMFQVKLRDDPTKIGFSSEDLLDAWPKLITLSNINAIGLMTIPPLTLDLKARKRLFEECRNLADQLGLKHCSMGMSQDWREAVDAGSTWIRIGSLLFGDRVN